MTKFHFFILFIASFIITSCAVHSGNINNAQVPHSSKGIVYKEKVYGYASCYYIFGLGGLSSQGLAAEALLSLKSGVELKDGEYLDHFTIDHRRFYFLPFYIQHDVLITADKIKDLDERKVLYDEEYKRQNQNYEMSEKNFFSLNERVFISSQNGVGATTEGIIIKHTQNRVIVISINNYGRITPKRKQYYSNIFKMDAKGNPSFFLTAKKGDTVNFKEVLYGKTGYKKGVFLGSNNSKLLIKDLNSPESYVYNYRNIIIEDSTEERRKKLNQEVANILKNTKPNQKLIGITSNNKIIKGSFIGFDGDDVVIQLEDSNEEITIDISNVYTHENWLEFSKKGPDKINTKVTYKKSVVEESVEILGYRYHRVLVRTDNGEIIDVPVGKIRQT